MPIKNLTPVKAIRKKCLDCSGDSRKEVRECVVLDCPLYPFRMGKNPNCKPKSNKRGAIPPVVGNNGQVYERG